MFKQFDTVQAKAGTKHEGFVGMVVRVMKAGNHPETKYSVAKRHENGVVDLHGERIEYGESNLELVKSLG